MDYAELPEFSREIKRLSKKYRTLRDDVDELRPILAKIQIRSASKHWNCLYNGEKMCVYKIRLACRYLKATTMRVVYAQHNDSAKIVFIELYFKGEKENEDRDRFSQYVKNNS